MKKKVALVLGAGGARGFCHIGVIEVLKENKIPIDIITGCSMGALIGGGFAAGVSDEQMRAIANKVTNKTVFDFEFRILRSLLRGTGLARGDRAMRLFNQHAGPNTQIEDCEIKFAAIATDLNTHSLHMFKSGSLSTAVRASISIPALFRPVCIDDKILVDGGVLKRMPIAEARQLGADIIIAVDAVGSPNDISSVTTLGVLDMSYQLMDWRSARHEGREADILIIPELGSRSSLSFNNNTEIIEQGRIAATKALPQIKRLVGIK
ncbi:MAG: patatin-like phospholipase family protein [Firmicutes bacterium]|nr:patatin-like phospholipase family protein [Bacillota bacterium]